MAVAMRDRDDLVARDDRVAVVTCQVLLAVLPVHALAPDVGVSVKPWLVVLAVAVVLVRRQLVAAARSLPPSVAVGWGLLLGGGLAGAAARPSAVAVRHLAALVLVLLVLLVWRAVRPPASALLPALRIGAVLIVVPALVESMLLVAGRRPGLLLEGRDGLVEPLGSIVYGDILVPHGLHVDSNFLALYAVVWVFLLLGHAPDGPPRPWDAVAAGGLVATVMVSFSRGGALALLVAVGVWLAVRRGRPGPARAWGTAAVAAVASLALLVAADTADGVGDLERSLAKRLDATVAESGSLIGEVGAGGTSDAELERELAEYTEWSPPRSVLWRAYAGAALEQPTTGIGFGTGTVAYKNYAHNVALEAAAGGGVAALAGTVLVGVGGLAALVRRRPLDRRDAGVAGAAAAVAVGSLLLSTNYSPLLAIVLALMLSRGRGGS